jgi:uncharacterized membrane protein
MKPKDGLEETEARIGEMLDRGTRISTVLLAAGLAATFVPPLRAAAWVLLTSGLVVLIATPMIRVAASIVGFARLRDWWFVLYTWIVFALLLGSVAAAIAWD